MEIVKYGVEIKSQFLIGMVLREKRSYPVEENGKVSIPHRYGTPKL